MSEKILSRHQLLAAEIFGYSYANYSDHLGIGHARFESLMPSDAARLEQAVRERWDLGRVAEELEVDTDNAAALLSATVDALAVVDAENPAEAFRVAVRQVVQRATAEGLDSDESIEQLVTQICYRVSDMAHLLVRDGDSLSAYCPDLRREPNFDDFDVDLDETS